jgi:uncharacterized protein (DUF885 family)
MGMNQPPQHRRFATFITALLAATVCSRLVVAAKDAAGELHALFAEHDAWELREFPERARSRGDYSSADRITDVSLAAIERRHDDTRKFLNLLTEIGPATLGESDRINYELFQRTLSRQIEGHQYRAFLMPVGGRFGPQQDVPEMHERVRFASLKDYENHLRRLAQVPQMIDATIELMRLGCAEGRTPAKVTLDGLAAQFDTVINDGLDLLRTPFQTIPAEVAPADRERLLATFDTQALPAVREAMRRLQAYFTSEYFPLCRETIAAADLPDGAAFYDFQLRGFTTTEMTAKAVHELGLSEVARIKAEMMQVIRASDFMQRPEAVAAALRRIRQVPAHRCPVLP